MSDEQAQEDPWRHSPYRRSERTRSGHALRDPVFRAGRVHFSRGTRETDAGAERSGNRSRAEAGEGRRVRFLQRARARGAGKTKKSARLRKSVVAFFAE